MAKGAVRTTIDRLRHVGEVSADDPIVLSAYISLDPAQFGTARQRDSEIESLVDDARRIVDEGSLSHDARRTLDEDIEELRRWAKSPDLQPEGVHGIAVFRSSPIDLFEVFRLSTIVGPAVHVDRTAHIETLVAAIPRTSWCVFLVNRRNSRTFRGTDHRLLPVGQVEDHVHGQHEQGG